MMYSALFKAKARAVLQHHWQTALLIALIVNLPTLLVQGIASFTNSDLLTRAEDLLLDAMESTAAMNALTDSLRALLSETNVLVMTGVSVLAWLITPVLSLGMNHWTLDRIRGAEEPVVTVFSRLRIFLKSIGLRLLIALRVLLWTLPGVAVFLLAMLPMQAADQASSSSLLSSMRISILIMYAGFGAMLVLGIMAYMKYALADFILADEPDERVVSCMHRSREMMNGRRGLLFTLILSVYLWNFLIIIVSSFVANIAGNVVGLMLQMLGGLFVSVYMLTSEGVFYEALRASLSQQAIDVQAEISDPQEPDDPDDPKLD